MLSFIIPAHNEEALIGNCLAAIHDAARDAGQSYEIIVVSDASTDRTAEIADAGGARVLIVNHRQIAATRNAGARAAAGDIFFFVDADTSVTRPAVRSAHRVLRRGAVGGGACVRFDGYVPLYGRVLERMIFPLAFPLFGLAPGCFVFCTREAYVAAGGYDESLFVAEEVAFAHRLKRLGRFVIIREHVITSPRKLRSRSALEMASLGLRMALAGRKSLHSRDGLEFWYGPRD